MDFFYALFHAYNCTSLTSCLYNWPSILLWRLFVTALLASVAFGTASCIWLMGRYLRDRVITGTKR